MKLAITKNARVTFKVHSRRTQPIKCSWREDITKHWEDSTRILADERKRSESQRKDQLMKMFETIKKIAQDEIDVLKSASVKPEEDKPISSVEGEVFEGEIFVQTFDNQKK